MVNEKKLALAGARSGYEDALNKLSKWSENRTTQNSFTLGYHIGYEACRDGVPWEDIEKKIDEGESLIKVPV